MSYFSNMVALAIHNWMSAAAGIAIAIALTRGFARRRVIVVDDTTPEMDAASLPANATAADRLAAREAREKKAVGGGTRNRQFLGGYDPRDPVYFAADLFNLLAVSGRAGSPSELQCVYDSNHARRRDTGYRAGSGCVAGKYQDAGDERGRLLQCQLVAPLREPFAAGELHPDFLDLPDSRRDHVHVREDGRQYPAGLGTVCGNERDVLCRGICVLRRGSVRQPAGTGIGRSRRQYGR